MSFKHRIGTRVFFSAVSLGGTNRRESNLKIKYGIPILKNHLNIGEGKFERSENPAL